MEQYSRRFIEELAKHINPVILDFFNKKKSLMNFPADNVAELIDETLMEEKNRGKYTEQDIQSASKEIKEFLNKLYHLKVIEKSEENYAKMCCYLQS